MRGLPVENYDEAAVRRIFWGLGTHLGSARYQNAAGELLGEVRDEVRQFCGEMEQMVAMTVFRALETGTPLLRCTVDGVSLAVDRRGRVVERLVDRDRGTPPQPRILDVTLDAGPGRLSPLAWLSDAFLWAVLACGALVLLHRLLSCARLIKTPPVVAASAVPPAPRDPSEGGS